MHQNAIVWAEIPVTDMARACKFYGTIFGAELKPEPEMGMTYAFLPVEQTPSSVGGALYQSDDQKPSPDGTVVYLNCGPDLAVAEARVAGAGGKVLTPKMQIGPHGFVAVILDSEGNKVGLHSMG